MLDGALEVLCSHFSISTGWITLGAPGEAQRLAAYRGLPPALSANDCSALRWTPCRCQQKLAQGALQDAPALIPCDRLELASGDTADLRQHATALLRAGDDVLGMIHLALPATRQLTHEQSVVLQAAGHSIGLALQRVQEPMSEISEQGAMLALTSALLGLLDVDAIAAETAHVIAETFDLSLIGVFVFEPVSRELVLRAGDGWPDGPSGVRVPLESRANALANAARERKATLWPANGTLPDILQLAGVRAAAAAPMAVGDKLMGLLLVGASEGQRLSPAAVQFLVQAAEQAALAFDRTELLSATRRQVRDLASLHERAAEQTRQLSETYGATLAVLGDALELRDEDTMGHTERVVSLAVSLGRQLGLPDEDLMHLEWGAYVHDLGKIGVPDAILRKPGPLSPEEWSLMKRHPEQGYTLLQRLFFLSRSLDVVRFHHERFDGKGYPLGLEADQIPLLARIFAVADAYDAMTNDRPYRRAMTGDEALTEMRRNRGTQFDPSVVDALEHLTPEERSPIRSVPQGVSDGVEAGAAPAVDGDTLLQFARVAGTVLRSSDLATALDAVVAEIQRRFGYPSCAILLTEPSAGQMQLAAQRGVAVQQGSLVAADQGLVVGRVLESAAPYYAPDLERSATPLHRHVRSELALPLSLDGTVLGVLDVGSPEPDAFPDGVRSVLEAFAMLVSFTVERARHEADMQRLALTDPVTGLSNQRALLDAAERELARASRHGHSVSLLTLQLDQFSELHRHSRERSTEALRTVARLLHQASRKEDDAGRREGGEYLLVLPETAKVGALLVAERVRADLARLPHQGRPLSVSIGVASLPDDGTDLETLLEAADQAMYRAVHRGGNEVVAAIRRAPGSN